MVIIIATCVIFWLCGDSGGQIFPVAACDDKNRGVVHSTMADLADCTTSDSKSFQV